MTRSIRFLLSGAAGLLLAGFVLGAAVATDASGPAAGTCPWLTSGGASCPALQAEEAGARELRLQTAGSSAAEVCPRLSVNSCPALADIARSGLAETWVSEAESACPALRAAPTSASCPGLTASSEGGGCPALWVQVVRSEESLLPAPVRETSDATSEGGTGMIEVLSI